jgi:predicted O-methyltransferase YrrM
MHYDPEDNAGEDEGIFIAEKEFDKRFNNNSLVKKIKMKSSNCVDMFDNESIDFIYIDGNHQYEFVKKDLINYVPKIKEGGIIAGHDYGGNPHTIGTKRAIDEFFENPPLRVYKDTSWLYIKN